MNNSMIQSVMNMTADVYTQQNYQSSESGVVKREWVYGKTIQCKIEPVDSAGARYDNKRFDIGKNHEYHENLSLKMKCLIPLSKRWRIHNIRSNDGKQVFTEIDKIDNPDTIFQIISSHAVLDPFGKISYYEVDLQRSQVQNDSTSG